MAVKVSSLKALPVDASEDLLWSADSTPLRVWQDDRGIAWVSVSPSTTPYFFPAETAEHKFKYHPCFLSWVGTWLDQGHRSSDMFMARQCAHIGTTGRTSARLAVSPVLFNVMLKKKFQKRFSVESCHAIGRFIEDRCEPRGLAQLKSRILHLEAELEKSRTALKTAWQDGGQEALDELEAQLCAPETANNIVLGAKVAEKTLRNLFCSITRETHAEAQAYRFELDKKAAAAAAAAAESTAEGAGAGADMQIDLSFTVFNHNFGVNQQPQQPTHSGLPKAMQRWDIVKGLCECANTYFRRYGAQDGASGRDGVFNDILDFAHPFPKGWDGWGDIWSKESSVDAQVRDLLTAGGATAKSKTHHGTYIRSAIESMIGRTFPKSKRRKPRRKFFQTARGSSFRMPNFERVLDVAQETREVLGVGCIEIDDIYRHVKSSNGVLGGPEIRAQDISFNAQKHGEAGFAEFDKQTIAGSSTDRQIQTAARTGLHDCGVLRNIQVADEPGSPVQCFLRNPESAIKLQLCKMEHMIAKQLHANPIPKENLNAACELEVTLRGVFWLDGSSKAAHDMTKIMMRMFTRKNDPGVQDLFGADMDIALAHELKRWLWLFESWNCGEHGHAYLSLAALMGCWMEQVNKLDFVLELAGQKVRFNFHCLHISADLKALEGIMGYMQSGPNKNVFISVNMKDALAFGFDAFNKPCTSAQDVFDSSSRHANENVPLQKGQLRVCPLVKDHSFTTALDLGQLALYLPWEKTHLLNTVKNIFYHIYDLKLTPASKAKFDLRYEEMTGRPGFKNDNWLSDFRAALMEFEVLFTGLLDVHETKIMRGLNHLRTIILLMSLDADSIDEQKIDHCRLSCFAYFSFIFDAIKTNYLPAAKLFNNYLLYTCIVFPRSYGTSDDKLCAQEIEAEGAEATWSDDNRHILFNSMRGGGRHGGLTNDLMLHLIRLDREHNMGLRWGRQQSATKGSIRARGIGVTSKAIAAGAFEPDFRLVESELNTETMRECLVTWLNNEYDGANLCNRPVLLDADGTTVTVEQLAAGAVITELRYSLHPGKDFVCDDLPTEDKLKTAYRKTVALIWSVPEKEQAAAGSAPVAIAKDLHQDTDSRVAKRQRPAPPKLTSDDLPRGSEISYRVSVERKCTCSDGEVRNVKPEVKLNPLTVAQLDSLAALYFKSTEQHVREAAHQAVRDLHGDRCHAKLSSFKDRAAKCDFVNWLKQKFGTAGLEGEVLGWKTLTPGWDDRKFDGWGGEDQMEEVISTFEPSESTSVLEQVRSGDLADPEVVGAVRKQRLANWSTDLGDAVVAGGGLEYSGGGRRHSKRARAPPVSRHMRNALGSSRDKPARTFNARDEMETDTS